MLGGMQTAFRFGVLNPRDAAAGGAYLGPSALGIEVTVPALAARCGLGNIDPQHAPGSDGDRAAIEAALDWPLPPDGSTLATIRPDLDSLGAMAVLAIRADGIAIDAAARRRIGEIAAADRHDRGPWPGARPLAAALADPTPLAALALAVADVTLTLQERVALLSRWLIDGVVPEAYQQLAAAARQELTAAVTTGAVRIRALCGNRVAVVIATRSEALRLGYCLAPVVIALNPKFRLDGGPPCRKFTVAQYRAGYADFAALRTALAARETGWGGTPTILGSPQGTGSRLSLVTVARAVCSAFT